MCPRTCQVCTGKSNLKHKRFNLFKKFNLIDKLTCSDKDICQNGATCINRKSNKENKVLDFECKCPLGYSGLFCEIGNFFKCFFCIIFLVKKLQNIR